MPKICKRYVKIQEGDVKYTFDFTIFYSSKLGFYTEVPPGFDAQFEMLTDEQLKEFSAKKEFKYKYAQSGEHKKLVRGKSEDGVEMALKNLLTYLLTADVKREPVIIVEFEPGDKPDEVDEEDKDLKTNELHKLSLTFGVKYCEKVQAANQAPRYFHETESRVWKTTHTHRNEIDVDGWNSDRLLIMPDTPENRQFVEEMHGALGLLIEKLTQVTESRESMQKFIQSSVPILTLPHAEE